MSIFSFLGPALSVAAVAAPAVANLVGTGIQTDAAKEGAAQTAAGLQKGADLLSTGYDQARDAQSGAVGNVAADQAKNFNTIAPLIAAIPGAYSGAVTGAANDYGAGLINGVDQAATNWYGPGSAAYAGTLDHGAGNFATGIGGAASSYDTTLGSGASAYGTNVTGAAGGYAKGMDTLAGGIYDPYSAAGKQALSVLQGISGTNASQMTPAQQIAMDNYVRSAQGSLAASGLRGSGRAVAATLDNGVANLTAQDTAQNQQRVDNATNALLNAGELGANQTYAAGSAGQGAQLTAAQQAALQNLQAIQSGAGAKLNAANTGNQAILNAVDTGAANQNQVMQKLGDQAVAANTAGQTANLNAANNSAGMGVTAANNLINATTGYLAGKAGTDLAQGQVDTSDIMGKASAQAGAAQGVGATNGAVTAANGANWGGAIGTLGGVIAANNKLTNFGNPTPYSSGGGGGGGGGGP